MNTNQSTEYERKTAPPILRLQHLTVAARYSNRSEIIIHNVCTDVAPGEIVAWVGESGAGKTILSLSVLDLLPENISISSGAIFFMEQRLSISQLMTLRGRHVAMIFQNPMDALNPVFRVGHQIRDVVRHHLHLAKQVADAQILKLFEEVGLNDPLRVFRMYPHQLSGGMAQRVMIAMALACEPDIIIADEPTTALDATTQYHIIRLLRRLHRQQGFAMILISHDIHLVSQLATRTVILQHGRIIESNTTANMFAAPEHEYTKALITA
ncbi:ABC transporter ATP-binding protein [candidate division KSB1 bacterium]|nr:ABC transporter ATP-binding protein [candidate division KSB1 bacterium]